jgi:hypothetical protein
MTEKQPAPGAGRKHFAQTVSKKPAARSRGIVRKPQLERGKATPSRKEEDKFYPLTYAGNFEGEELHVYRVELSVASLFALGVSLPVEDRNAKIKTDLLVGADGVPRAIRLAAGEGRGEKR